MGAIAMVIIGLFVLFSAGVTQGLTGFGFNLVSVPILVIFLPPKIVVPVTLINSALTSAVIVFKARKWVDVKRIWPLMIAGIAGMPFGTYLLIVLEVGVLKVSIGVVIALFAVAFLVGFTKRIKNEKLAFAPVGFVSGLLTGSMAMSGPPVILFFTNQGISKRVFRASIAAYFMVLTLATIPIFAIGGLMTQEVITYTILFMPAVIIGALTGIVVAHKVGEGLFKKIALVLVILAGLLAIASGLGVL